MGVVHDVNNISTINERGQKKLPDVQRTRVHGLTSERGNRAVYRETGIYVRYRYVMTERSRDYCTVYVRRREKSYNPGDGHRNFSEDSLPLHIYTGRYYF